MSGLLYSFYSVVITPFSDIIYMHRIRMSKLLNLCLILLTASQFVIVMFYWQRANLFLLCFTDREPTCFCYVLLTASQFVIDMFYWQRANLFLLCFTDREPTCFCYVCKSKKQVDSLSVKHNNNKLARCQ
jgi:hypothetical protein